MGCGQSMLESDEKPSPEHGSRWRPAQHRRRRSVAEDGSVASTPELYRVEDPDFDCSHSEEGSCGTFCEWKGRNARDNPAAVGAEEERKKGALVVRAKKDGNGDEEHLGSPSFRFYFENSARDSSDGSVRSGNNGKPIAKKEKINSFGKDDGRESVHSSEGSECKSPKKKKKGKRRGSLKKRHFFNGRGFSNGSSKRSASSRVSPTTEVVMFPKEIHENH